MTHTYKVGDKGKTRGNEAKYGVFPYEVTAIGETSMLVKVDCVGELKYILDGTYDGKGRELDLTPPKRRIQGWVLVKGDGKLELKACLPPKSGLLRRGIIACIYIDIEEGEGL